MEQGSIMSESKHIARVDVDKSDPAMAEILKDQSPLVAKFTATWCAPCRALQPTLEQAAQAYEGRVRVIEIDIERSPECAEHLQVQSVPSLLFFSKGKLVKRCVGALALPQLKTEFESLLWYIDAKADAQSAYEESNRAATEKREARLTAAYEKMDSRRKELPEAEGFEEILQAAYGPIRQAVDEELKEQKAQFEAGTLDKHAYHALRQEVGKRIGKEPRFQEGLDKVKPAGEKLEKATAAAGISQEFQAEMDAAWLEYNTTIEATQKSLQD
jgi:thioredoxin 1